MMTFQSMLSHIEHLAFFLKDHRDVKHIREMFSIFIQDFLKEVLIFQMNVEADQ